MYACIFALNFPSDAFYQRLLLDCAYAFSPRVEQTDHGTVIFDVEGLERLIGSNEDIAAKVLEQVASVGMTANVAIAANPDAAIAAARGLPGLTVLKKGSEHLYLQDLPLEVISPPFEIFEILNRWGISTLGAFAKLPAADVTARLDQEGLNLHKLARGVGMRPLILHKEEPQFEESMEFDYAVETIEPLTFVFSRLIEQICRRLQARNLSTHEVHLTLRRDQLRGAYIRVLRLPLPIRNSRLLTKLLILDLEAHPPGKAVTAAHIKVDPVKPRVIQNGLFTPLSPEPEKLELTLARIAAVVGENHIGGVEVLDTHHPDSFRMKKFGITGERRFSFSKPAGDLSRSKPSFTLIALRLFRPRLEATVETHNRIPCRVAFHGVHGRVITVSGPWRTSGDWWNVGTVWTREEWDVEILGSVYRIHWDAAEDRWFVEGVYD